MQSYDDTVALLRNLEDLSHKDIWADLKARFDLATFNKMKHDYRPDANWALAKRLLLSDARERGWAIGRARAKEETCETGLVEGV